MAVKIPAHSRLRFATLVTDLGFEFWDVVVLPNIPEQPDDLNYTVLQGDRIDTLAYRFYGDPVLWWVIAVANGLELLPTDLNDNAVIRIPSPRYVLQQFFNLPLVRR